MSEMARFHGTIDEFLLIVALDLKAEQQYEMVRVELAQYQVFQISDGGHEQSSGPGISAEDPFG